MISGLIDTALSAAVGFLGGLFGGSKTKKAAAVMQSQADALMIRETQQSNTLKWVLILFAGLAVVVFMFIVLRRRK